ncbi:MAG: RNA polymerase sigma factor [Gammaproteobacteria bacterium]
MSSSRVDDRAELLQALDAHAGLIIASAARVLGNLADAEDVAQDIAEKLLKQRPPRVENWPAYLRTLAVNRAIDRLRRRKDWPNLEQPEGSLDPEATLYREQRADILRRAIAGLSERDGRIFSLYYFGDLTHADIASQMNMTPNAVGVALHRVRARLTAEVSASLDSAKGDRVK